MTFGKVSCFFSSLTTEGTGLVIDTADTVGLFGGIFGGAFSEHEKSEPEYSNKWAVQQNDYMKKANKWPVQQNDLPNRKQKAAGYPVTAEFSVTPEIEYSLHFLDVRRIVCFL